MKVGFSPVAKTDLIDISVYIAQDNPARALTFVNTARSAPDSNPVRQLRAVAQVMQFAPVSGFRQIASAGHARHRRTFPLGKPALRSAISSPTLRPAP